MRRGAHGRAVQVHPIKAKLKPPVSKSLRLKCDKLLSNVAFKFNLRRYSTEVEPGALTVVAGGFFRSSTRPTLNRRAETSPHTRMTIHPEGKS